MSSSRSERHVLQRRLPTDANPSYIYLYIHNDVYMHNDVYRGEEVRAAEGGRQEEEVTPEQQAVSGPPEKQARSAHLEQVGRVPAPGGTPPPPPAHGSALAAPAGPSHSFTATAAAE